MADAGPKDERAKPRREGFIAPKGDGKWLIRWYVRTDADGKQIRRSKVVKGSKREAEKELRSVLKSRDDQTYVDPSRMTLDAYLDRWLESMQAGLTPRTHQLYVWLLARYVRPVLGPVVLQRLTTLDLQGLVDAMQRPRGDAETPEDQKRRRADVLSTETVRKVLGTVSHALRQAVVWHLLVRNPAVGVKLPKKRRTRVRHAFTVEQMRALLRTAEGTRYANLWAFLLATGARPQEALGLRWSELNLEAGMVTLGAQVTTADAAQKVILSPEAKTAGSLRTIPIPPQTVAMLREHRARQNQEILRAGPMWPRQLDLVFPNEAGRPCDQKFLTRLFKTLARRIDVPEATAYWCRHTVATQLLAAGENPKVVAERLGHTSTQMVLDTYGHVLEGMQQGATEKLGALLYGI